ncbi:MAG: AraC family transcriptional regulator [Pseudomonadota bacterium]
MKQSETSRYARRINKVIAYILQHLDDELDLEKLGKVANFSAFHFHRQFTSYTGITVFRLVQLLRLQRASMQLVFNPKASVTDIALEAGFANAESFTRAFRKAQGQTPSAFRKEPQWQGWQVGTLIKKTVEYSPMQVDLVDFPETSVAALEHHGPERLALQTSLKFIEWRKEYGIKPDQGSTYGLHYKDYHITPPEEYRMDICVSVTAPVPPNAYGVINKVIPAGRCARVRHLGSRHDMSASVGWLFGQWLPASGEKLRDYPAIFHYVNVGPGIKNNDMITDIYLPLE